MSENSKNTDKAQGLPDQLPLLVTGEVVIFPRMVATLLIDDKPAIRAVDTAVNAGHKTLVVFGQKSEAGGDSDSNGRSDAVQLEASDLYPVGSAVRIVRMLRQPDGPLRVLVSGITRVGLQDLIQIRPYPLARVVNVTPNKKVTTELEALARNAINLFERAVSLTPNAPTEVLAVLSDLTELEEKADFVASQLNLGFEEMQEILGELDLTVRWEILNQHLTREVEVLELRQKIESQAAGSMDEAQKEYLLRQQLKAIREELGDEDSGGNEIEELKVQIEEAEMPEEVRKEADRELSRMEKMPRAAAEYTVSRTYLDWLVSLPWNRTTEDHLDVEGAQKILDEDHFGLEKPKERILEYLAVRRLKEDMRGPILCLVGPPGTGKTSLGNSIARAMGRKFARISLGGVHDESEIRGHRRTYVGALPGRIMQGLRRAETANPVFMLDEIDKLGADFRGDPSAALLEVPDPEQNHGFVDHYLDVPFDLSKVMFIATANTLHTIPPALLDRMEVLELSGYTDAEKLQIAKRYLVPKQLEAHGLSDRKLQIDEDALLSVIQHYTREAGLRNLEREIGTLCRKVTRKFAQGRRRKIKVRAKDLHELLGAERYRHEMMEEEDEVGVATGLAWTPVGGDALFVEATTMPGKGNLKLTGQVGDVMRESVEAAMTFVRSRWEELGLEESFNRERDVHIHVPAGAVPKDGPSAGVTMATVLASAFTGVPVRKDVAMTGEITLRGKVLPIGGVRDKVLAAHRSGIKTVILPEDNKKDLEEVPESVRDELNLVFAKHADCVLDAALVRPPSGRARADLIRRRAVRKLRVPCEPPVPAASPN